MKKLLALLLVFSFAFSVSATTSAQSKITEKVKIEKSVFAVEAVCAESVNCQQLKIIAEEFGKKTIPVCNKQAYIYEKAETADYDADISKEYSLKMQNIT